MSVGLVTSLAANNGDLQDNLTKNGVLWSLLLFLFEYDYTLDESGVVTEAKSNQQKLANNLARMAILSIVALAGYDLKLELDPSDPINAAIKSLNTTPKSDAKPATPQTAPAPALAYTSNAQNVIQNNAVHAAQSNNTEKSAANFKSYVNLNEKVSSSEEAVETEIAVEKENATGNKKYKICGTATNVVVKKIVDQLLTKFIADKFATHSDAEVSSGNIEMSLRYFILSIAICLFRC